jgi:serine/threonine-protein kinase HSL1 (negative regulator of Swe1 kinase)
VRIARHSRNGEHAAVKIIDKTFFNTRLSMANLDSDRHIAMLAAEREITIMKLVNHPSILRLHDVWETSSELFLVLEYAESGELFDYLCAKGRLSTTEALGYFQQIMAAIDYCHRLNICHRDLKPENILLDKDHNIKIADFGMAVWQSREDGLLDTACGSPHYAAPEVIQGTPYSGAAADIWSCGVILYALLVNRLPFDHEDLSTLLGLIMAGQYKIPSDVDTRAADLVRRMLTQNPAKRITMAGILKHPFFVSAPTKSSTSAPVDLNLDEPLPSSDAIDWNLFANMKALWNDLSQDDLVDKLLSDTPTYQKAVYHLLVQYRDKHSAALDLEAEAQIRQQQRQGRKRSTRASQKGRKSNTLRHRPSPLVIIPPIEVNDVYMSPTNSLSDDEHLESYLTSAPQSSPRPSSPLPSHADSSSGPLASDAYAAATSAVIRQLGVQLPRSPEASDERVQEFLQQVLEQLHAMDARSVNATKVPSPDPTAPYPSPLSAEFGLRKVINPTIAPPPSPSGDWFNGLGLHYMQPSAESSISPPLVPFVDPEPSLARSLLVTPSTLSSGGNRLHTGKSAPQTRKASTTSAEDKENQLQSSRAQHLAYQEKEYDDPDVDRSAWLIIDKDDKPRPILGQKPIQSMPPVDLPAPLPGGRKRPPRLNFGTSTTRRTASGSSSAASSLPTPTSPRPLEWIGGLFKGKPVTYQLLSTRDSRATREECWRLLTSMGIDVQLSSGPGDAIGFLACAVPDALEFGETAGVAFRIVIRRPTSSQFSVGYAVAAHIVREQGTLAGFKAVFNLLRRAWEFDVPVSIFAGTGGPGQEDPRVCFT